MKSDSRIAFEDDRTRSEPTAQGGQLRFQILAHDQPIESPTIG